MHSILTVFALLSAGASLGAAFLWLFQSRVKLSAPKTTEFTPVSMPASGSTQADALVLVDVDQLADMNARYGPDIGDRVLERITDVIRRATQQGAGHERLDGGRS